MTEGNITKLMIQFALPLLLGNLFQQLYNLVDSLIIGNYEGTTALAAVGIGHYPLSICVNFFLGLGTGVTVLISQYFGAKDHENLQKVIHNATSLVLVFSVPLMVFGYLLSPWILRAVHTPADSYALTYSYMVVLFIGIAGTLGYNMNAGILRGMGDSISPLLFLVIATLTNIALDFLFIGFFHWSAFGAALATVIAQWSSWIFSIIRIKRKYPEYEMRPLRIRFNKPILRNLLTIGLPLAINQGLFSLGHTTLSGIININGTDFAAAYNICMKVDSISFLSMSSFASAVTTYAGQNIGAHADESRLKKGFRVGLALGSVCTVCATLFLVTTAHWICSFFDSNPVSIDFAAKMLYRFEPFYIVYTLFYTLNAFLNGLGIVKVPLYANLILFWAVRLPAAYLFNTFGNPVDILFCYPISWVAGLCINLPFYLSGKWKKRLPAAYLHE